MSQLQNFAVVFFTLAEYQQSFAQNGKADMITLEELQRFESLGKN